MIDQDKTRQAVVRTVPGHGELTREQQEAIAKAMELAFKEEGDRICEGEHGDCGGCLYENKCGEEYPCAVCSLAYSSRYTPRPRFTPEEVAVLDYACKCCGIDCTGVLERLQGGALKLHGDGVEVFFPGEFFPSLRPGQSVALADIVGSTP